MFSSEKLSEGADLTSVMDSVTSVLICVLEITNLLRMCVAGCEEDSLTVRVYWFFRGCQYFFLTFPENRVRLEVDIALPYRNLYRNLIGLLK
jgi:hypothetical protein